MCIWYTTFNLCTCTNSHLKIMVQNATRTSCKVIVNILKHVSDLNLVNVVFLSSLKLAYVILKIMFLPHIKQYLQYKYQMVMQFGDIKTIYSRKHTKHNNAFCEQNAQFINVKASGTNSNHCVLRVKSFHWWMTRANFGNIHLVHTELTDAYWQTKKCMITQPNVCRCYN